MPPDPMRPLHELTTLQEALQCCLLGLCFHICGCTGCTHASEVALQCCAVAAGWGQAPTVPCRPRTAESLPMHPPGCQHWWTSVPLLMRSHKHWSRGGSPHPEAELVTECRHGWSSPLTHSAWPCCSSGSSPSLRGPSPSKPLTPCSRYGQLQMSPCCLAPPWPAASCSVGSDSAQ